jgi:hypothetical protein
VPAAWREKISLSMHCLRTKRMTPGSEIIFGNKIHLVVIHQSSEYFLVTDKRIAKIIIFPDNSFQIGLIPNTRRFGLD